MHIVKIIYIYIYIWVTVFELQLIIKDRNTNNTKIQKKIQNTGCFPGAECLSKTPAENCTVLDMH